MRPLRTLVDSWLVRYPYFSSTESYSYATAMSHIPLDSSRPAGSNETLADTIQALVVELPQLLVSSPVRVPTDFSLVTAAGGPRPRAIYHSIRLISQTLMRPLLTLADPWLVRYPSFSSTESYSYATPTSHIPIDSYRPADSNETLPDGIRPLVVELPQLSAGFLCHVVTDLSLLPAPDTASSPIIVYYQPVYSPLL